MNIFRTDVNQEIFSCIGTFEYLKERVRLICFKSLHWYFLVVGQVPQEKIEVSGVSFTVHNLNIILALHLENLSDEAGLSKFNIDLFYPVVNFHLIAVAIVAFFDLRIPYFVSTSKYKERIWFSGILFNFWENEYVKILVSIGNLALLLLWCYQSFRVDIGRSLGFLFRE